MKNNGDKAVINSRIWLIILIASIVIFTAFTVFSVIYINSISNQIKSVTEENDNNTVLLDDYTTQIKNENLKYLESVMLPAFSEEQLTEIAKNNFSYIFTVNGTIVSNGEVVYLDGSTVSIGFIETIKENGLPENILKFGRVKDFSNSFEDFSTAVKITCGDKVFEKSVSSKNLSTSIHFTCNDIEKGDIITVLFSDDLEKRVGLGRNYFEIVYNG